MGNLDKAGMKICQYLQNPKNTYGFYTDGQRLLSNFLDSFARSHMHFKTIILPSKSQLCLTCAPAWADLHSRSFRFNCMSFRCFPKSVQHSELSMMPSV